jgi:hypothetical protein
MGEFPLLVASAQRRVPQADADYRVVAVVAAPLRTFSAHLFRSRQSSTARRQACTRRPRSPPEQDLVDDLVGRRDLGVAVVPGKLREFEEVERAPRRWPRRGEGVRRDGQLDRWPRRQGNPAASVAHPPAYHPNSTPPAPVPIAASTPSQADGVQVASLDGTEGM